MGKPKPRDRTWIKNHALEGDGLVTGFYNFLYKRNTKTMKPCKDVFIPDTIVFDHNFPRGWYTSDLKAKEISKKQGKELDAASIASGFSKPQNPNVLIVASYMCSYEIENAVTGETEMCTQVEFFNEDSLKEFVGRKIKREGILQRFMPPKGHRNSVIQAVWSPRVCIVQRRTNISSIGDKVQAEKDPYNIAVTYEGPSHFSEEGSCAAHTTLDIKNICSNIVSHFYATEHKYITRMVLYFKVDEKDQVWLLWCGSLRVSDRDAPSQMPLNLAPNFTSPSLEVFNPENDDRMLKEADVRHLEMTNDTIFYENYVRERTSDDEGHSASRSPLRGTAGGGANGGGNGGNDGDHNGPNGAQGGRGGNGKHGGAGGGKAGGGKDGKANANEPFDWEKYPGIQDQYRELCADRDYVVSALEDIFYEAYGHFLRHEPGPFSFSVDRSVAQTLGEDLLADLMIYLRIEHAAAPTTAGGDDNTSAAVANGNVDAGEDLRFSIPVHPHTPVARMSEEAVRWVKRHYQSKEQELRDEAVTMPADGVDEGAPTNETEEL